MSFLSINHIHHTYFTRTTATTALQDVSLEVENGEFISFLGPSGCGKTTLLSIIAGLVSPTEGHVLLDGNPIKKNNQGTGYMLQQDYLFPWKTIEENVLLGLKLTGKLNERTKANAFSLLEKMDLRNVRSLYPRQLSGGMRQRVALVRTLATEPKLLLLDEPFSALDYQTKLKLEDLVSDTLQAFQKTAILVTHDIGEAIAMSDRIILFSNQPGTIHQTFSVPGQIRALSPFMARNDQAYTLLFHQIWEELESLETKNEYHTPS